MAREEPAAEAAPETKKKTKGKAGFALIGGLVMLLGMNGIIVAKVVMGSSQGAAKAPRPKPEEVGEKVNLDEFVLNVHDGGWLTTKISVGLKKGETAEKFQEEMAPVRDAVIGVLTTKNQIELSPEGRDRLKEVLREAIDKELGAHKVLRVYFTSFAMQKAE